MAEVNTDINELRWLDIVFWFPCIVYLEAKQLELYFADRHHILPRNQDNIRPVNCESFAAGGDFLLTTLYVPTD